MEKKVAPNWRATATTIYCDVVKSDVTIIVRKDWTTACIVHKRLGAVRLEKRKGIPVNTCEGPDRCPKVLEYRDRLYREELATQAQVP